MDGDYDFAGYATRNDITCSDGRVIRQDAFAQCDGKTVPLVWMHDHMSPSNVLGHAMLKNMPDGVRCFGKFNKTAEGLNAKEQVKNGDITGLSIYANQLKQNGHDVVHGSIREVSLVLAGANPGAFIDTVIAHSDDTDEEAVIYSGENLELAHACEPKKDKKEIEHAAPVPSEDKKAAESPSAAAEETEKKESKVADSSEKTVQDVIDSMSEEQKNVMYALVGAAMEDGGAADDEEDNVKHNVFQGDDETNSFAHADIDFSEVLRDAKRCGSLKDAVIQHGMEDMTEDDILAHAGVTYGMENVGYLFPDYKNVDKYPTFISRDMGWVNTVTTGVSHTPFSRLKTLAADITEDDARAKGYIKGNMKKEEFFTLLKRTTDPQTVYKKQKMDRDDVLDITDFDVIAWLKSEMRMMLDEEIARAILVGDGRPTDSDDKIKEDHIRPIAKDDDLYAIKVSFGVAADIATNIDSENAKYTNFIRSVLKARKNYKGSGSPTLFTTEDNLTGMLLMTDKEGRDLYDSVEKLASKLRVSKIVTVPVMEGVTRTSGSDGNAKTLTLEGVIVNLKDYNVGADKGGAVNMFDDFDIDYNQQKYLIETRCSGALVKPYSAIVVETFPNA